MKMLLISFKPSELVVSDHLDPILIQSSCVKESCTLIWMMMWFY